jgi:hypothetical protein
MFYGELDPKLGNKTVSAEEFVATMSAQTALGDHRREHSLLSPYMTSY